MAVSEQSHAHLAIAGVAERIGRVIVAMVSAVQEWNDARLTRNMLSKLSDGELDDIGLTRADIDRVARGTQY